MTASLRLISAACAIMAKVAYYIQLAQADYYAKDGCRLSLWCGKAASRLGFVGQVTKEDLLNAFVGKSRAGEQVVTHPRLKNPDAKVKQSSLHQPHPISLSPQVPESVAPIVRKPREAVAAIDIVFSVAKSISLAAFLLPEDKQQLIVQAARAAVREALGFLESEVPLARRGKGGHERIKASIAAATFVEFQSRAGDPHLHIHCVIPNIVYGEDGKYSSINTSLVHQWTPTLGRIFRASLAHELKKSLGVELERPLDKKGQELSWFELKGIPKALLDELSTRRKQIVAESGLAATERGTLAARIREKANLKTRRNKGNVESLEQNEVKWRQVATEHGVSQANVLSLLGKSSLPEPQQLLPLVQQASKQAVAKLLSQKAFFGEHEIVREVVEKLQHVGFSGPRIANCVRDELTANQEIVYLANQNQIKQFTTREMLRLEQTLLNQVHELSNRPGAQIDRRAVGKLLRKHPELSDEQTRAVTDLLSANTSVRILSGHAGAGKSTALRAVREGFANAGFEVIGGALSGAATQELRQKTGVEARTVASHLYHLDKSTSQRAKERVRHDIRMLLRELIGKSTWKHETRRLTSKTVLLIDEAGMLDTRTLSRLVQLVDKAKATLILAGDAKQLSPIGPGGPFQALVRQSLTSSLTTNHRQSNADDIRAVAQVRKGHIESALNSYAERGMLKISDTRDEAIHSLVDTWTKTGGVKNANEHVILTQTRADSERINRLCQAELHDAQPSRLKTSIRLGEESFHVGDRVLFQRALRLHGIENGNFGEVEHIDRRRNQVSIRLDQPRSREERAKGLRDTVTLSLTKDDAALFSLGFASTTHKLQGQTVKNALVLLGGSMSDRELFYVQVSRAKENTRLFTDKQTAGPDLSELIRALERSRQKPLAHDLVTRPSF